ncbi:MAG: hypothetical protein NPIRA04_29260 [Nitrospirales bacterium]|nr:MAG: hypothetical protein NPIRA04_29260 [Nitrospirales bacterium]
MSFFSKRDQIPQAFQDVWKDLDHIEPLLTQEIAEAQAFWETYTPRPQAGSLTSRWSLSAVLSLSALAAVMVMAFWWWWPGLTTSQYQTAKGEQRTITLDDGSIVMLNTDTTLSVRLSDQKRIVELEQGEARFTVVHDARPFEVIAGNGSIHDLGTEFIVKHLSRYVEVSVFEGVVEVGLTSQPLSVTSEARVLNKGQQVRYTRDGHMSSIASFNDLTSSAWTEGKLIFHAQPLKAVLAELARYAPGEIRLLDPTLADLPISGIFNLDDLASFPQVLQDAFPVKATQVNSGLVVLDRRSASP